MSIIIDGIEYVPAQSSGERLCIAIVDNRGLTFVGHMDPALIGQEPVIRIRNARCVIRWGTEKHLSELADCGPSSVTTLGHARTVWVRDVVVYYECGEAWNE